MHQKKIEQITVGEKKSLQSTWDSTVKELLKDFTSFDTNAILKYFLLRDTFETTPHAPCGIRKEIFFIFM